MILDLPILDIRAQLLATAKRSPRIAVIAPTGSGKSTQIPQMLLDGGLAGDGRVVVLQPRRIAARMLAARVAEERGGRLGGEVGYQVRFESAVSNETRILFETEGILLRRMLSDRTLSGVSVIVFDEFHERHLYGDLTLSEALRLQRTTRPDLLLVVMSATLDINALRPAFEPFECVESAGRMFPVDIEFLPRPLDPKRTPVWEAAAEAYARVWQEEGRNTGDALIFMPGAYEIQRTIEALRAESATKGALILPLHGELPPREQDAAVARSDGTRKIIVATNVAETSLTIDGVRVVIDSGLARIARFDPYRGINTLLVENISRASADQRAGRAGRTMPGRAIRLWTEREHSGRALHELPEIKRVDPSEILLILKALGVESLADYPWVEPPTPKAMEQALILLRDLGALNPHGGDVPTPLGLRMLDFPLHPRHSRMMLAAAERGAVRPAALIAALAQSRPVFLRKVEKAVLERRREVLSDAGGSDLFLAMRAFRFAEQNRFDPNACGRLGIHAASARQTAQLYHRFVEIASRRGLPVESSPPEDAEIAKCILAAFSDQVAKRLDQGTLRCELVHGRRGELARESIADETELLVASEVQEIGQLSGVPQVRITQATAIAEEWLREMYPQDFEEGLSAVWDAAAKRVVGRQAVLFRGLALFSKPADPPPEAAAEILAQAVLHHDIPLKKWDHAVEQWIERTNLLAKACPDWSIPAYDDAARAEIIRQICHGAFSAKEIRERPVLSVVRGWLSGAQQALVEKSLPERVTLSNGRTPKVQYVGGADPYIALRIQEIFGVEALPKLAGGRIELVIHILAPSQRPVQITRDLPGFWRDHYPRIKKELSRKYPKHRWA